MDATHKTSSRDEADQMSTERRLATLYRAATDRPLLLILAVAFILRALAAVFFTGAIDAEGAEYARIAQNLLWGNGYVGISEEGTQLFFPPLFPFAIAGVSLLTGDAEIAGRIISVTTGALIVLPTYFIATKMYGRRTAALAAALVGCHPFLIYMSTTVFCEMTYMLLILAALCLAMSATENPTPRNLFASGAMYGLAYLMRPEAAACMLISATLIFLNMLIRQRSGAFFAATRVGLTIGTFVLVAAPYVAWVSAETGQFRLEGKSSLNIETERRIQLGEQLIDAAFGVDSLGNERGVWNQPNLVTIQAHHSLSFKEFATYIRLKTKSVAKNASEALGGSLAYGSPPLFALAVIGLFARPWSPSLAMYQLQIFGVLALVILATYFISGTDERFYVLLVPFYCIWASVGLPRIVLWGTATGSAMGLPKRYRSGLGVFMWALGIGSVFMVAMGLAGARLAKARASRPVKMAGEWLHATSTGPVRVLDRFTDISFHAKALHFWLPPGDEKTALRYIERKNVNVVVVRTSDAESPPYLKSWADNGILDPRAKLVYSVDTGTGKILIYRIER
jgi:4-amino-4-deoxy-L-arabinose transferase-like glycosyltransferase